MKTVTNAFVDTLRSPSPAMVRQVWYKRRYWVASTKTYAWETNWTQIPESNVVSVSEIIWQLDIQTLNEFKTSNVTIALNNLVNQWKADNPWGVFKKDSISPTYGYEPYWTKFRVQVGVIESDGTTEVVTVFTGVATEYNVDSGTGAMQINVSGLEALLQGADAEKVSTAVVNETLTGTVDGVNKVFTTAHNAVGYFTDVSTNGITKRQGVEVSISQLSDASNPGKVTYAVAPAGGTIIRGSYIYWKTSQKFEDLVTALLNQAGVPGGSQQVAPVIFPNNIINTHEWNTQALWQGGSALTNIDTALFPNTIHVDFLTDAQTALPSLVTFTGWSKAQTGAGNWAFISNSQINHGVTPTGTNDFWWVHANTAAAGVYTVRYTWGTNTSHADTFWGHFMFNAYGGLGVTNFYQGYALKVSRTTSPTVNTITLVRNDSSTIGVDVSLGSTTVAYAQDFTFKIVRSPGGYFRVMDSTLTTTYITATDNTYTSGIYYGMHASLGSSTTGVSDVNTAFAGSVPSTSITGTWVSDSFDSTTIPTAWTQILWEQVLSGGTPSIAYYTESSPDNSTWDSYVAVTGGGVNGSTLRRYLRIKAVLVSTLANNDDPSVASLSVGSITTSTTITVANFLGMTCYDAITALGQFANYEFGFDPNETFYFRPRTTGITPQITLDFEGYNMRINQILNGYARVYSFVRATYGTYQTDIFDDGMTAAGPITRQGLNRIEISGGNILVPSDADVATGVAGSFFNYFREPRRLIQITTKTIPQIDLSDVAEIDFADNTPMGWYIGDNSVYLGDPSLTLWGVPEQPLQNLIAKVVGVRINTDEFTSQFQLEEVLI